MSNVLPNSLQQYLSPPGKLLAGVAIDRMSASKDPYHDWTHTQRMLQDFEFLLKEEPNLKKTISPEVVILSICWHDTWKAGRIGKNSLQLLYHQLMDGLGSALLFRNVSQGSELNEDVRNQVFYAIRKHAQFQLLPTKTKEAHILRDLDDLELLSHERWSRGKHIFALASGWRSQLFRRELLKQKLSTDWAVKQKLRRLPRFLETLNQHIQEITHR